MRKTEIVCSGQEARKEFPLGQQSIPHTRSIKLGTCWLCKSGATPGLLNQKFLGWGCQSVFEQACSLQCPANKCENRSSRRLGAVVGGGKESTELKVLTRARRTCKWNLARSSTCRTCLGRGPTPYARCHCLSPGCLVIYV